MEKVSLGWTTPRPVQAEDRRLRMAAVGLEAPARARVQSEGGVGIEGSGEGRDGLQLKKDMVWLR